MAKIWFLTKRGFGILAISLSFASALIGFPAFADDDPFEIDSGRWMSSAHYQDVAKDNAPQGATQETSIAVPEVSPPNPTVSPNPAVVALPTPAMPGLNKGFDVQVSSTEDAHAKETALVVAPGVNPDIHLPDTNWKTPPSTARAAQPANDDDESDDQTAQSLNIRMSYLPAQNITPIPDRTATSAQKLGHALMKKNSDIPQVQPAKAPNAAACAALDTYKKQQLDAIQSDRETLKALQDAIHSLGVSKKIDFTPGNDSALNVSNNQTLIDTNVSTAPSAR